MSKFGAWVVQINIPYKLHYMLEMKQVEHRLSSVDSRVHFKVCVSFSQGLQSFQQAWVFGVLPVRLPLPLSPTRGEQLLVCCLCSRPGSVTCLRPPLFSVVWFDSHVFCFFSIWTPLISSPQAFTKFISRKNRPDVGRPEAQVIRILLYSLCFMVCHDIKCWWNVLKMRQNPGPLQFIEGFIFYI